MVNHDSINTGRPRRPAGEDRGASAVCMRTKTKAAASTDHKLRVLYCTPKFYIFKF